MAIQKLEAPKIGELYGEGVSRAPVIKIVNSHIITAKSRPMDDEKLYMAYRIGQAWHGKPTAKFVTVHKEAMDEWVQSRRPRS